jgi:hypothetical protein
VKICTTQTHFSAKDICLWYIDDDTVMLEFDYKLDKEKKEGINHCLTGHRHGLIRDDQSSMQSKRLVRCPAKVQNKQIRKTLRTKKYDGLVLKSRYIAKSKVTLSIMLVAAMALQLTVFSQISTQEARAQVSLQEPFEAASEEVTESPISGTVASSADTADEVALDELKVDLFLFGITEDTGNVVTFITINNLTKTYGDSASILDKADNMTDGIAEVFFSFPEMKVNVGDKFEVCALKVDEKKVQCTSGFKTPYNRTEIAQLLFEDQNSTGMK